MSVPEPENKVIKLLDKIIGKKEKICLQFLDTLKELDVNEVYPELQQWITTLDLPGTMILHITSICTQSFTWKVEMGMT